jgi:hypothetical protein
MEGKELADAIKIASFILGIAGIITAAIWRINEWFSGKDSEINKGHNQTIKEKIKSVEKIADTNHQNLKEDVGELKIEVAQVLKGMTDLTIELKSSNKINKAVINSNNELLKSKGEEVNTLKKGIELREEQMKAQKEKHTTDQKVWAKTMKEMIPLLDNPEAEERLDRMEADLNKRIKDIEELVYEIEESVSKIDKSVGEELKRQINELSLDLKEAKEGFHQFMKSKIKSWKKQESDDSQIIEEKGVKKIG